MESPKSIIFLSILIMILFLSQYMFSIEEDSSSQSLKSDKLVTIEKEDMNELFLLKEKALTEKFIESSTRSKLPQELIDQFKNPKDRKDLITFLDDYVNNFKIESEETVTEEDLEVVILRYKNGSTAKIIVQNNGENSFLFKDSENRKFSRSFYNKKGKIKEYVYIDPVEEIITGFGLYPTGELNYRLLKNEKGFLLVYFNKSGEVTKYEDQGFL